MKSYTQYLLFNTESRQAFINITSLVEEALEKSGILEGLCLVNAMHITSSVFINDDETGLHKDFSAWLEKLAPYVKEKYNHNNSGEDNGDAHLKRTIMGREVVVAITRGKLDFGPWEQIFTESSTANEKKSADQDNRRVNENMKIKNTVITVRRLFSTHATQLKSAPLAPLAEGECEGRLRAHFRKKLLAAARAQKHSLAFVIDSTDSSPDCLRGQTKILAQEIYRLLHQERHALRRIDILAYGPGAYEACRKNVLAYMDYIENKLKSPFLTVDAIIEYKGGIVLIKRSNPPFGWAIPGGFVDYGEPLEKAVAREAKEETNLNIYNLRQVHTYSDPKRDPRFHTVCTVFSATGRGTPRAGDDALRIRIVRPSELKTIRFAFDHGNVLRDYLLLKSGRDPY